MNRYELDQVFTDYYSKSPPQLGDGASRQASFQFEQAESVRRHYQSPDVAVLIPLRQAVVSGALLSGFVFILASTIGYAAERPLSDWMFIIFGTGGVFFLRAMKVYEDRQGNWKDLVWSVERFLNVDLSGDHQIGEPKEQTLNVSVTQDGRDGGKQQRFLEMIGPEESIRKLLEALVDGGDIDERSWIGEGNPFTPKQFRHNRQQLMAADYADWNDREHHEQGWYPTEIGINAAQAWLDQWNRR